MERKLCVGVFKGDKIAAGAVGVDLEAIGDPVAAIVAFEIHEEAEGQLGGCNVAGNGQQFAVVGVEGGQDHTMHLKGEFGVVLACVCRQQFGLAKIPVKGGVDGFLAIFNYWGGEAAADAERHDNGYG